MADWHVTSEKKSVAEEQAFAEELERGDMVGRRIERTIEVLTIWMLICTCYLFLCCTAFAEEKKAIVPEHTFALGFGVSNFDYHEDPRIGDVEIGGLMWGVVGRYTYHNDVMINASVECSTGDLDYEGHWMISGTPSKTDVDSRIVECRGLIGYDCMFKGKHVLTPFLGIGYRYWNDELKGSGGFEREVRYWYSPIGIRTHSLLSDNWTWGMRLEYDLFWDGEADYYIPHNPTHNLDSGHGARFSLRLGGPLTKNADLSFEPYVTYWHIDKTDLEAWPERGMWVNEPNNETISYGLRVSVEF